MDGICGVEYELRSHHGAVAGGLGVCEGGV